MIFLYSSILFHSTVFNMSPKFHIVQTLQSFQYSQSLTIVVKMVWKRVEKFLLNKSSSCWLLIFHKAITRDLHAGMFYLHLQTCSHPQSISFICFSTYLLQVSFGLPLFLFSNGVFLIATLDTLLFIGYGVWQKDAQYSVICKYIGSGRCLSCLRWLSSYSKIQHHIGGHPSTLLLKIEEIRADI